MPLDPSTDCDQLDDHCDPCAAFTGADTTCGTPVVLSYTGLVTDATEIRKLLGSPSEDPNDPLGYLEDSQITAVVNRNKSALLENAQKLMDEQCNRLASSIDEQQVAWQKALYDQQMAQQRIIQELTSERDAQIENQQFAQQTRSQELAVRAAGLQSAYEADVVALIERYITEGLPPVAADYYDEVEVSLRASETIDGVSYGMIEEPYIPPLPGRLVHPVSVIDNGDRKACTQHHQIEQVVKWNWFEAWRYSTRGRYLYVVNNGRDIDTAYMWLTTRSRLEDYAKTTSALLADLEAANEAVTLYAANPVTQYDAAVEKATEALSLYNANKVTEFDGIVQATETALYELCVNPPLLTGDSLIADIIPAFSKGILEELQRELETSSRINTMTAVQQDT